MGRRMPDVEVVYRGRNVLCLVPPSAFLEHGKDYVCLRNPLGIDRWSREDECLGQFHRGVGLVFLSPCRSFPKKQISGQRLRVSTEVKWLER